MKLSLSVRVAEAYGTKDKTAMTLDELIDLAKAHGYEALCMRASQAGIHTRPDVVRELGHKIRAAGLAVSMVTGVFFPLPTQYDLEMRDGSNEDRIRTALRSAARACSLLEAEFEGLRFSRQEFDLSINDRALAPNTEETYESCNSELPGLLQNVFGTSELELQYNRDPRSIFGAVVKLASAFDLASLAG